MRGPQRSTGPHTTPGSLPLMPAVDGVAAQRVNHKRTAWPMRQIGLFSYTKRRRV